MTKGTRKTLVAFVLTLLVEAAAVWVFLLLHGSFLDLLRTLIVLVVVLIVFVIIGFAWHALIIPSDYHDRDGHHE